MSDATRLGAQVGRGEAAEAVESLMNVVSPRADLRNINSWLQ
jgi:hypothetical protein